jgi:hypothetical protein
MVVSWSNTGAVLDVSRFNYFWLLWDLYRLLVRLNITSVGWIWKFPLELWLLNRDSHFLDSDNFWYMKLKRSSTNLGLGDCANRLKRWRPGNMFLSELGVTKKCICLQFFCATHNNQQIIPQPVPAANDRLWADTWRLHQSSTLQLAGKSYK